MKIHSDSNYKQIPPLNDTGYFFLLLDNVLPYAVASPDEVIMALSDVGAGCIGFISNENYLKPEFYIHLKEFFLRVSKSSKFMIMEVDDLTILFLEEKVISHDASQILAVWNPHKDLNEALGETLLSLVYKGLKVIISFNSWSGRHLLERSSTNVLRSFFNAAGIWPSSDIVKLNNFRILQNSEYESMPLFYLLDYALVNMKSLTKVSNIISNILFQVTTNGFALTERHKTLNLKITKLYSEYIHFSKACVPCVAKPILIKHKSKRKFLALINAILLFPTGNTLIAPGVSFYPGSVELSAIPEFSVKLSLIIQFSNEILHLGYYLPPGKVIEVTAWIVKSDFCLLHINYHLFDVWNQESWNKWPKTRADFTIQSGETLKFSFAFGGLLSLSCAENLEVVNLSLSGVVQIPTFDSRGKDISKSWKTLSKRRVPWIILGNDAAVFVLPFIATRNILDPTSIMEVWNFMIKQEFHLKGHDVSKNRRELISADLQIIDGYMHSGYPIGTLIEFVANPRIREDYLLDENYIRKHGKWGLLHEIGHNLQDPLFTFEGTEEVTNNIFTLVATETLTTISSWAARTGWVDEKTMNVFVNYIKDGKFEDWKLNYLLALGCYAQLKNCFGWELYRKVFRRYNRLAILQKTNGLNFTDNDKIQLWIRETSWEAKMNLVPFYELWRFPVSTTTKALLDIYPPFLPQDFLTEMVNETVSKIIKTYGGSKMVYRRVIEIKSEIGPLKNPSQIKGKSAIIGVEILQT